MALMVAEHDAECGSYQACCDIAASRGAQSITRLLLALNAADRLAGAVEITSVMPDFVADALAAYRARVEQM